MDTTKFNSAKAAEKKIKVLKTQKKINNSRAKMPNFTNILKRIQLSLMRIKHKKSIIFVPKNYAVTAIVTV